MGSVRLHPNANRSFLVCTVVTLPRGVGPGSANDGQDNAGQPGKTQIMGGGGRDVDNPAPDEGASVVDAYPDRAAVALIGHLYQRAEWQRTMSCGKRRRRCPDAACGSLARIGVH